MTAVSAFAMLCPVAPRCCAAGEAAKQIQELFDQAGAAFDRKDADAVAAIALPDAEIRYLDGTNLSIDQWKEKSRSELAGMASMHSEFKVGKADVKGDAAVVLYSETEDYTLSAEKDHAYRAVCNWRAALERTPDGWRVRRFTQLSQKIMRDGTLLSSTAPPRGRGRKTGGAKSGGGESAPGG